MFRGGLGKEKTWALLEIKTLFSVQNSKAALLRVGSCFSTNKLALLITWINLYSHQQSQSPSKSLPCCLPSVLEADCVEGTAAGSLVNDLLSAARDTSLSALLLKAVPPSCRGQPWLSNPRGIRAHHGMSLTCGGSPVPWPAPPGSW